MRPERGWRKSREVDSVVEAEHQWVLQSPQKQNHDITEALLCWEGHLQSVAGSPQITFSEVRRKRITIGQILVGGVLCDAPIFPNAWEHFDITNSKNHF